MNKEDTRKTVPEVDPTGHEEPGPAPGEPAGTPSHHDRPNGLRAHLGYAIGVLALLLLLGWLTFDVHPDPVLLVYVAALAIAYRILATHPRLSRRARENLVFPLLTLGLLALLGILSGWSSTYLVFILTTTVIYAIFGLGLNLEFGYTGIINFGHVAFMAIGAYTTALLSLPLLDHAPAFTEPGGAALGVIGLAATFVFLLVGILASVAVEFLLRARRARSGRGPDGRRRTTILTSIAAGGVAALLVVLVIPYPLTPLWATTTLIFASALAGMVVAGIAGAILGLPTLRLRADYLAIVTIGAAEILRRFLRNERWLTGGPNGVSGLTRPFAGAAREWHWLAWLTETLDVRDPNRLLLLIMAMTLLLLVVLTYWILLRSPYGRVLKAIREDEEVATALGKNVFLYKIQVLAVGSMVAALAGAFLAWERSFISPQSFIPLITFYAWIVIVAGGVGNIKGTILGAVILQTFFEATRVLDLDAALGLGGPQSFALRMVIIGLLLVFLMLFKPEGILGHREEMVLGD